MFRLQALCILTATLSFAVPAAAQELPVVSGDRLNIVVAGEMELSRAYVVDQDGTIFVPVVGKVPVKDLTLAKVREELSSRLAKYVREPQVSVEFAERAQITVGFTGAVGKPGPVTLKKGSRLLDGLSRAEGATVEADVKNVRLQRPGEPSARVIDLSKLLQGEGALNVELREGDAIFVPRVPMNAVQVLGAVQKPGEVQRKERITLLEAVLAAGGLNPEADKRKVQVLRKGTEKPEMVNLDDVLNGAAPNQVLADGDVVTIPAQPKVTVKVFGHVAKPGEGEMKAGTTLLEAVTAAGGFTMEADKKAVFITLPDGEVRKADLEKLESPDGALPLPDGTKVFVPQAAQLKFAVAGGVNTPGVFPVPTDGKKVFLTDALAAAGGMVERAKKKTVTVIKKNPNGGQPIVTTIDFEQYLKKKDPSLNPEINATDVVYVDVDPERERRPKPWEYILGALGGFLF